jgi:hypothetical protein
VLSDSFARTRKQVSLTALAAPIGGDFPRWASEWNLGEAVGGQRPEAVDVRGAAIIAVHAPRTSAAEGDLSLKPIA